MFGYEKTNLINFYLTPLGGLKHQQVSFPDIQENAINAGYLNQEREIGEQKMPEDVYIHIQGCNKREKIFLHKLEEYRKNNETVAKNINIQIVFSLNVQ
ncbi:hypothetical protein COM40_25300 [Bacillus wiedmannii]|uniref:hypothetical protein n=1 Tax=Bacillus wiedmannii TaxID=1890302 RepID=UPI000C01C762|nr:hypothetical protein [Bacillus wiedmannii]PGD52846.1 hypothetical protein COM40_25300 [Bacillus wiedmannii]